MCVEDRVGNRVGGCDVSGKNLLSPCNVIVGLTQLLIITNYYVDVSVSDKS